MSLLLSVLIAPTFKLVCRCLSAHNRTSESIRDEQFGKISTPSAPSFIAHRAQIYQGQELLIDIVIWDQVSFLLSGILLKCICKHTALQTKAILFTNIFAVAEELFIQDSNASQKERTAFQNQIRTKQISCTNFVIPLFFASLRFLDSKIC